MCPCSCAKLSEHTMHSVSCIVELSKPRNMYIVEHLTLPISFYPFHSIALTNIFDLVPISRRVGWSAQVARGENTRNAHTISNFQRDPDQSPNHCSRCVLSYKQMTPVGLEPTVSGSVGRRLIHWATGPLDVTSPELLSWLVRPVGMHFLNTCEAH